MSNVRVLVATSDRAVAFGTADACEAESVPRVLELRDARNLIYWTASEGGLWGAAVTGPGENWRIGAQVASIRLVDVRMVLPLTPEACARLDATPVYRGGS